MGNTPNVRFKGFTEDWEQRKLGEYVSIISGEAPSKFEEGTELYVKVDDLNYNDKYVVDTQNKVAEHSTVKRVTKGSVVFPKRGAAIMTNKVRIMGIDSYMDTNMMALTSEKLDSEFLYNIISKEGLYKIADTSTIPQINNKHVEPYEITIPSLVEQRRIGAYFKQLDHLITLHQQKCDETKEFKKYMLQNMFPQKDEKVPKIRFDGFTEDWEQRKLSDVVDSVDTGKSKFDKEGSSGEYPILGSTSVIGYDDEYDYEGDFILTARVGANAGSLYRHAGKVKISDNTVFIQASQNIEFFYQLLIRFDIKRLSFGTGQPLVKASELKRLELMMPTDMEEQMRIGVYFKNLDHLITLHQQKCNTLKEFKKYMLQNMFPQKGENKCQN